MKLRRSHAIKYPNVPDSEASDTEFSIQSDFLQQTLPENDFYDRNRQMYFTGSHCPSPIDKDVHEKSLGHRSGVRLERFTTPPSFPPSIRSQSSTLESIASTAGWTEVNDQLPNPQMTPERERIRARQARSYWVANEVGQESERIAELNDLNNGNFGSVQSDTSTASSYLSRPSSESRNEWFSMIQSQMRELDTALEVDSIDFLESSDHGSSAVISNSLEEALLVFDSQLHGESPPLNASDSLTNVWDSVTNARYGYQNEVFTHHHSNHRDVLETFIEVTSMYTDTESSRHEFDSLIPGSIEVLRDPELNYGHRKHFKKKKDSRKHLLLHRRWLQKMKRMFGIQR